MLRHRQCIEQGFHPTIQISTLVDSTGAFLTQEKDFQSTMEREGLSHQRPKPCTMFVNCFAKVDDAGVTRPCEFLVLQMGLRWWAGMLMVSLRYAGFHSW